MSTASCLIRDQVDDLVNHALLEQESPVLSAWSLRGFWAILRAETLIIESGNAPDIGGHDIAYERLFLGRFRVVQTWHGTPMKRICLDALADRPVLRLHERIYRGLYKRELRSLYLIIALSDLAKQRFKTAFDSENITILGYPKNDVFFGDPSMWKIRKSWAAYDKVILYAPTFRDHAHPSAPFSPEFLEKLNDQLRIRNWCLLVKKHAFDRSLQISPSSNIFDVSETVDDIQEILVETDILISDYSSVFIDYLICGRPIIFYVHDLAEYLEKSRKMYCDYLDEVPGPFARTEQELETLLFSVENWFEDASYRQRFQAAVELHHHFQDGFSSLRLAGTLKNARS